MRTFLATLICSAVAALGASTNTHWAYQLPKRPSIPELPAGQWTHNAIDAFVISRLTKERLEPSSEADRSTLIRRLSFDLRGLPPRPEEVDRFVHDPAPKAYEHLVDRFLASPHFGEHWGRHWLDLARYADSDGYEKDGIRPFAYVYRDWVIKAINDDLPFDEFTIQQLAGDLLPEAATEQRVATGFHRQTLTNKEGGVDQEEFRCKATVDRASTTGTIWLGLTVGCAECHNHKYDPISQKEFFQLYAFFNKATEQDIPAPTKAEKATYAEAKRKWNAQLEKLESNLHKHLKGDFASPQAVWETQVAPAAASWEILEPTKAFSTAGASISIGENGVISASGKNAVTDTYIVEVMANPPQVNSLKLEVFADPESNLGSGRAANGNFVLSELEVELMENGKGRKLRLHEAAADFSQDDFPVANAIDGDPKTGWGISPKTAEKHAAIFNLKESITFSNRTKLTFKLRQENGKEHTLRSFRFSAARHASTGKPTLLPPDIELILQSPARTSAQQRALAHFYREEIDPQTLALKKELGAHRRKAPALPATKAAVLAENDPPRKTHIHTRGDFLRKGDEVAPGVLAILHPLTPRGPEPDRLDLARWLFDPANPLTARVSVNHIWKHLFGRGLVATVDDFGVRGEHPSHPDLLDWLATEFPRLGWSRKALIKYIVLSQTYRQSSAQRPELEARDPLNVFLARQSRLRLQAENVRDAFLVASGALHPAIGGPSVRPPLPADIAAIGYANSVKWTESEGADKYRRGLYTFLQRTVPYPMLVTFDAPDANATCTRRERSNTPLQALTLLNDPVFFECAQKLARKVAPVGESTPQKIIEAAFENCLSRRPTSDESSRLERLYHDQIALLKKDPAAVAKISGGATSEQTLSVAALTVVTRTIMNLDEFITRE